MVAALIDVMLPIAFVVAVGFLLRRQMPLDLTSINRLAVYGLNPALVFVSLVRADVAGDEAARLMLLPIGLVAVLLVATLVCALPLGLRGPDLSALLLGCLFMNSGNYGLPLATFAFGEAGFERAMLFFIPQSIMAQTLGVGVAAAGGLDRANGGLLSQVMRRVLRMPQVYAVLAALAVRASGVSLDEAAGVAGALFQGVVLLAQAALSLLLLVLGMQLAQGVVIERPRLVAFATGMRLVISPALAYGLALALGLNGLGMQVSILQAAMPTAVNMTILALEFNARPPLVVGTVVASSLGSVLTLSLLLSVLR